MNKKKVIEYWEHKYKNMANCFHTTLWKGTAKEIVSILKNNNKKNSIKKLQNLREEYKNMSLSNWYVQTINQLEGDDKK